MSDYEKAMMHVELALRRTYANLRSTGETNIENILWALADEIGRLGEEARKVKIDTVADTIHDAVKQNQSVK